jgi:hypothetical protein
LLCDTRLIDWFSPFSVGRGLLDLGEDIRAVVVVVISNRRIGMKADVTGRAVREG